MAKKNKTICCFGKTAGFRRNSGTGSQIAVCITADNKARIIATTLMFSYSKRGRFSDYFDTKYSHVQCFK